MRPFLDEDFLLDTQTARELYHGVAEGLPILDYHCHVSPREIAEDRVFHNLTQLWLEGDHYKWRLMRAHGVPVVPGSDGPVENADRAHHRGGSGRGEISGLGRHPGAGGGQSPLSLEPSGAQTLLRL